MRYGFSCVIALGAAAMLAAPAFAADTVIYNNLTPNNSIAIASRPDTSAFEIEAGDDFFVGSDVHVNSASFVGLIVPGTTGMPSIADVVVEIYRVFPNDSNVARTSGPPTFSTSAVPTRVNSPSDVAFASRDSAGSELAFTESTLNPTFTALNSVAPGGIHPMPMQTTGGNGSLTGEEVQFDVTFTTPFDLPSDHYFFVPQVEVNNDGEFYWLSADRPATGQFPAGVTDLQAWTRDARLDPDWLRVGTDIVGGATMPTFNAAFELAGTVPEPSTAVLTATGVLALIGMRRRRSVL